MNGSGRILGYSTMGFFFGLFLFFTSFRKLKEKRLIQNTPTSKIRSLAMGLIEVYGKVLPNIHDLIKTPFSSKSCVYCKWLVEEFQSSGKNSRWVIIRTGYAGRYFFLKDDTGTVLIDAMGAHMDIPKKYQTDKLNENIKNYLSSIGLPYKGLIFNKKLRFTEYYLAPGDQIYVMGNAGDNPFVEDGTSDRNEADIMIQKGNSNFYYISDKSEKEILKKYNLTIYGGMLGGGVLSVVCLAIIFVYIGLL